MEQQDWDAETARGLREYHAKHGRASDAAAMPRAVLEMLATIEPVNEDQEYGPGRVVCPACGAWMSMRWGAGNRLDKAADMTHNVHCPAVWARKAFSMSHGPYAAGASAERSRCLGILRSVNNPDNPLTANDCVDLVERGTWPTP